MEPNLTALKKDSELNPAEAEHFPSLQLAKMNNKVAELSPTMAPLGYYILSILPYYTIRYILNYMLLYHVKLLNHDEKHDQENKT